VRRRSQRVLTITGVLTRRAWPGRNGRGRDGVRAKRADSKGGDQSCRVHWDRGVVAVQEAAWDARAHGGRAGPGFGRPVGAAPVAVSRGRRRPLAGRGVTASPGPGAAGAVIITTPRVKHDSAAGGPPSESDGQPGSHGHSTDEQVGKCAGELRKPARRSRNAARAAPPSQSEQTAERPGKPGTE